MTPAFTENLPGASLVMDQNGSLIAAWSDYDARARRFAPDGTSRGESFRVSAREPTNPQAYVAAALLRGGLLILWTDTDERDGNGWGLYARIFGTDGRPLSRDLRINVTTAGHQYDAKVATASRGPVVAVWSQYTGEGEVRDDRRLLPDPRPGKPVRL